MLREFVERDVRKQIIRRSIGISSLAFVAVVALWYSDSFTGAVQPLRMFINNIHGGLSALAIQIGGGGVVGFTLSEAGHYTITFDGGQDALTMSAGYLGSAFLGAVMFYVVNRAPHLVRGLAAATGAFTIAFLAFFIRPENLGNMASMAICVAFGFLLIFLGLVGRGDENRLFSRRSLTRIVMTIISLMTACHILLDLGYIMETPVRVGDAITNPVAYFAEVVMPSASVGSIALAWSAAALAMLGIAFYFSIVVQLRAIPKNDDIY